MIRGTSAQFKFKLPYTYDEIQTMTIKFWQPGNPDRALPIIKQKHNCSELAEDGIYVSLRPSETAKFSDRYKAKMQLIAQPYFGATFGSKERLITVYPMPDDIIIDDTDPDIPVIEEWIILDGGTVVG